MNEIWEKNAEVLKSYDFKKWNKTNGTFFKTKVFLNQTELID